MRDGIYTVRPYNKIKKYKFNDSVHSIWTIDQEKLLSKSRRIRVKDDTWNRVGMGYYVMPILFEEFNK